MSFLRRVLSVALGFLLLACAAPQQISAPAPEEPVETAEEAPPPAEPSVQLSEVIPPAPDYAYGASWAVLSRPETDADVFYVYPTVFDGEGVLTRMDAVNREDLRKLAAVQVKINSGVFSESANIYAPYYRQASIEILKADAQQTETALAEGYGDILRAFDHYMKNLNIGKPFVLAGHGQGSAAVLHLMKERFDNPKLQKQLIAAYIIGWSVTKEDVEKYPWLKAAQKADDTGVIISYNTRLPRSGYSYVLREGSAAINPVNWKTDNSTAPASMHKGAVMFEEVRGRLKVSQTIPNFSDTYLEPETGALVVNADTAVYNKGEGLLPEGSLHMYDYLFFYNNLKDNVSTRIKAYFKNNSK